MPIAVQAARHLKAEVGRVIVVVRSAGLFEGEGCETVVCKNADEGMGASLACGVRAAGRADGYLVALADMPFVRTVSIAAVRDALAAGAPLAAPYWRAKRGHPVGISGGFFDQLVALGMDADTLGAAALGAGHTDIGVRGLEQLAGGGKSAEGQAVLDEALRTRILTVEDEPLQAAAPPSPFVFPRVSLTSLPELLRETEARWLARAEARRAPQQGENVTLRPRADEAHLFDPATGERLGRR